jgi:hypothetical protein
MSLDKLLLGFEASGLVMNTPPRSGTSNLEWHNEERLWTSGISIAIPHTHTQKEAALDGVCFF